MKQRINLYGPDFAPQYTLLSLNSLMLALGLSAALFALGTALLAWQGSQRALLLDDVQSQVSQLQTSVDHAQQALAARKPNPQLLAAIERQKLALSQRQRLLQELSSRETVKNNRFSQVLADLSTADTPAIWLTSIHMSSDDVRLEGYGTQPDAMPNWLIKLSETPSFAGTDFKQANMLRQDEGVFFTLQTQLESGPLSRGQAQ